MFENETGKLDLHTFKCQLNETLRQGLKILCEEYRGPMHEHVRRALKIGNVYQAYYLMTLHSMKLAVETKKIFFIDPHLLINVVKDKNWTLRDRSVSSAKTPSWIKAIEKTSRWWTKNLASVEKCIKEQHPDTFTDTYNVKNYIRSRKPTEIGSYIHAIYSEELCKCAVDLLNLKDVEINVPGRLIHSGIAVVSSTPDCIVVRNTNYFHMLIDAVTSGLYPHPEVLTLGQPEISFELKTVAKLCEGITEKEILEIFTGFQHHGFKWAKKHTVDFLRKKFINTNWIPSKINKRCSAKELLRLYTLKSTKIFPRQEYEKIKSMYVGANNYPNFLEFFDGIYGDIAEKNGVTFNIDNINKYSYKIQPQSIATPGQAKIIIYSVGEDHKKLLELTYDHAPFILAYNSPHFNQIMVQNITVNSYTVNNCKTVYCIALPKYRSQNDISSNQLAISYMYDVNICESAANMFSEKLCKEFALAEQYRHGKNILSNHLLNTNKKMREKYLYRPLKM